MARQPSDNGILEDGVLGVPKELSGSRDGGNDAASRLVARASYVRPGGWAVCSGSRLPRWLLSQTPKEVAACLHGTVVDVCHWPETAGQHQFSQLFRFEEVLLEKTLVANRTVIK